MGDITKQLRKLRALTPTVRYLLPALGVGLLLGGLWMGPQLGIAMQATAPPATTLLDPPSDVSAVPVAQAEQQAVVDDAPQPTATALAAMVAAATATPDERPLLERTLNILVLGSDRRPDTPNWRTDVMMIVALDLEGGQAGVISIPRDVYIDAIPNHQPNRVNVIDYLGERDEPDGGGPALLKEIIHDRMDIRIDHFLRFDFSSFQEVVDALGGVTVEVDCPYYDYFSIEDVVLNIQPGLVEMSGAEALVYVRSRRLGGDLDRVRRQQRFVWAVRNQVLNDNLLPRVPALYQALDDSVQSDIGIINAIRIVRFALALDETDIHGFALAPPTMLTSGWRLGMSVFVPDWPTIRASAQELFSSPPFLETNTPTRCP